jgi:hypothetical protein
MGRGGTPTPRVGRASHGATLIRLRGTDCLTPQPPLRVRAAFSERRSRPLIYGYPDEAIDSLCAIHEALLLSSVIAAPRPPSH